MQTSNIKVEEPVGVEVEGYASECRRICPFLFVPFEWTSDILYTLSDITACPKPAPPIPPEEIPAEKARERERAEREEEMTEEERKVMERAEEEYKRRMAEIYPKRLEVTQIMIKDSAGHAVNGMGRLFAGEPFNVDTVVKNRATEDVDVGVFLAVNGKKLEGTDRRVRIDKAGNVGSQVTTVSTAGFDPWSVVITKPKEPEGYNLCVVARPITGGIEPAKGCREIHVLPKSAPSTMQS